MLRLSGCNSTRFDIPSKADTSSHLEPEQRLQGTAAHGRPGRSFSYPLQIIRKLLHDRIDLCILLAAKATHTAPCPCLPNGTCARSSCRVQIERWLAGCSCMLTQWKGEFGSRPLTCCLQGRTDHGRRVPLKCSRQALA